MTGEAAIDQEINTFVQLSKTVECQRMNAEYHIVSCYISIAFIGESQVVLLHAGSSIAGA